jgi:hypothetical protein
MAHVSPAQQKFRSPVDADGLRWTTAVPGTTAILRCALETLRRDVGGFPSGADVADAPENPAWRVMGRVVLAGL